MKDITHDLEKYLTVLLESIPAETTETILRALMEKNDNSERTFLENFVALNDGTEVPPLFAFWSGLGCVSAALGRQLWCEMGHYQFFTNLAIVLVAGAGRMRKSTAINMGEDMVRELTPPPNLLPQKCTTEKLLDCLLEIRNDDPKALCRETAVGFLFADELVTFLNHRSYDQGLGQNLMPLLDAKKEFIYATMLRGEFLLKNVCLGLIAGTTVPLLREAIPREAIGGGLTSRLIFVYSNTPMPPVLWTEFGPEKKLLRDRLVKQLQDLTTLTGQMRIDDDAKRYLDEDYKYHYNNSPMRSDTHLMAYASRRHIHIIKIAMCLSALSGRDMLVKYHHMKSAKEMVERTESSLPLMMRLVTASEEGGVLNRVLDIIESKGDGGLAYNDLMELVIHEINQTKLQEAVETLTAMDKIEMMIGGGNETKRRKYRVKKQIVLG